MKLLFITNEIPYPPDNGVRIVSYNAIRMMKEMGYSIALAILTDEPDSVDARFQKLLSFCDNGMAFYESLGTKSTLLTMAESIITNEPFFVTRYYNKNFKNRLSDLITKFEPDVVHIDLLPMLQYVNDIPNSVRKIASINDSYALTLENAIESGNYSGLMKLYKTFQLWQVKKYESKTCSLFDTSHLMTEVDATYLKNLNNEISTSVIPNGVCEDLFSIDIKNTNDINVLFIAKLEGANLVYLEKFIKGAWHLVIDECPNVKLHIVGKTGEASEKLKNSLDKRLNLNFCGYAETLSKAYSEKDISIVPINKNCGLVNKAIEGMAAGLAVVGFNATFQGIPPAVNGENCIAVDSYEEMAKAIIEIIKDDLKRDRIRRCARKIAKEYYSWKSRMKIYNEMYFPEAKDK